MDEQVYWLGFSQFPGVGPGRFRQLLAYFGTAKTAWGASLPELKASKLGDVLSEAFVDFRRRFSLVGYEKALAQKQVTYLTLQDSSYPMLLKEIKNPPFVLFVRGNADILRASLVPPTIGIVGTRKITDYGQHVTELITTELVAKGCIIVSGLAFGVDAVAHQTTIDCGGKTIAVLGCGIDCCSPRENQALYDQIIASGGAIVSEYGLGFAPTKGSFPSRNRIIAGLSQGVVVTEGAANSGALYTANDAFASGRKVFAVPGSVTSSLSQGPFQLLKQGAVLVSNGHEVLAELGITSLPVPQNERPKGDTPDEQKIIDLLLNEKQHIDELVRKSSIAYAKLSGILSLMELKGIVKHLEGGFFSLQ